VLRTLRQLRTLLERRSRGEVLPGSADAERMLAAERALARRLARPVHTRFGAGIVDRGVALALLRAYLFSGLFRNTVGQPCKALSSVALRTFPLFTPPPAESPRTSLPVFRRLCEKLGVHPSDRAAIEDDYARARRRLAQRIALVAALKSRLRSDADGHLDRESVHALFARLFPGNPMRSGEVDLVATGSALYFYIASEKTFTQRESFAQRTPSEQRRVRHYLRRIGELRFENFSHFPMFGFFDAHDADPRLVAELKEHALIPIRGQLIEAMNSVVTMADGDEVEKYLIHDTWGHVWQGDLTNLKRLVSWMADLQHPFSPDHAVDCGGSKVAVADLFFLNARGGCDFDAELARAFVEELLRDRAQLLLAPVIAEVCADMVEYYYALDHRAPAEHLPTSSFFGHRPTKLDFAWTDMCYFVKSVAATSGRYRTERALRRNFIQRLGTLLMTKYPAGAGAHGSARAFERTLGLAFEKFLRLFESVQAKAFDTSLRAARNFFVELLLDLLRAQMTINRVLQEHLEADPRRFAAQRMIPVFFVAHYFEQNPLGNFKDLADAVGRCVVPFLKLVHEMRET
jgi:hypothetical protein